MPLPADFPQPPRRPPATQPLVTLEGMMTPAWLNYLDAMERYQKRLRAYLDTL